MHSSFNLLKRKNFKNLYNCFAIILIIQTICNEKLLNNIVKIQSCLFVTTRGQIQKKLNLKISLL